MTEKIPWCEACGQFVAPEDDELCPACDQKITWVPEDGYGY